MHVVRRKEKPFCEEQVCEERFIVRLIGFDWVVWHPHPPVPVPLPGLPITHQVWDGEELEEIEEEEEAEEEMEEIKIIGKQFQGVVAIQKCWIWIGEKRNSE